MIPESLDDWDHSTIQTLVESGRPENDRLDFKADLPDASTLTKVCASFANTRGGFLVFGVEDEGDAWSITGLKGDKEFPHEFGQKLRASPSIDYPEPKPIRLEDSGRFLYVVKVPRSQRRPHVHDKDGERVFWKRSHGGSEEMTLEEIRGQMRGHEEMRTHLKRLIVELDNALGTLRAIKPRTANPTRRDYVFDEFDTDPIGMVLAESYPLIREDSQLIQSLQAARRMFNRFNNHRDLTIAKMGNPRADEEALMDEHINFMRIKSEKVEQSINIIKTTLEKRYGISRPD